MGPSAVQDRMSTSRLSRRSAPQSIQRDSFTDPGVLDHGLVIPSCLRTLIIILLLEAFNAQFFEANPQGSLRQGNIMEEC